MRRQVEKEVPLTEDELEQQDLDRAEKAEKAKADKEKARAEKETDGDSADDGVDPPCPAPAASPLRQSSSLRLPAAVRPPCHLIAQAGDSAVGTRPTSSGLGS